ncbi:MAG TPA: DUF3299 domain-containing protein [Planctomycetota bacterium]
MVIKPLLAGFFLFAAAVAAGCGGGPDAGAGGEAAGPARAAVAAPVSGNAAPAAAVAPRTGGVLGSDDALHAGTLADPIPIDIDFLGAWEFNETLAQPFPERCLALDGKVVTMRGFMLPDVDFQHIRRFHLVRSLWGCCFGAPPRINEIVRIELADEDGVDYTYNTLQVTGTMNVVFEQVDGIVEDLYRVTGAAHAELGFDDPLAPTDFDPAKGFDGVLPDTEY